MRSMLFLLAAVLAATPALAKAAPGARASIDAPFVMDGVRFSGCKAAESFALKPDGSFKPEFPEHCHSTSKPPVKEARMGTAGGDPDRVDPSSQRAEEIVEQWARSKLGRTPDGSEPRGYHMFESRRAVRVPPGCRIVKTVPDRHGKILWTHGRMWCPDGVSPFD